MTIHIVLLNNYHGPLSFTTEVSSVWFDEKKAKAALKELQSQGRVARLSSIEVSDLEEEIDYFEALVSSSENGL